jgi:hypothetical protein
MPEQLIMLTQTAVSLLSSLNKLYPPHISCCGTTVRTLARAATLSLVTLHMELQSKQCVMLIKDNPFPSNA